jgi:AraC family transcriptional regulator, transcriptional activator for feuABC-ybbA operon
MQVINRCFMNTQPDAPRAAVFALPLEVPYYAHVLHTTFRNFNVSARGAKRTHVHDVYHIVMATAGKGSFVVGDREIPVERGALFLTSPGQWHSFGNGENDSVEYCEVTFEFKSRAGAVLTLPFNEVMSAWAGAPCPELLNIAADSELQALFMNEVERMARIGFMNERDFQLYLNEGLARIFLGLYTHAYMRRPASPAVDAMQSVHEHIHKHYNEALRLPALAKLAGVTPNYLSRRFKHRYGAAPIYYQHRLRIQAASDLLRTTEHPIKRIAEIVGFSDVYFFSRMFKKIQGVPPGAYRRTATVT